MILVFDKNSWHYRLVVYVFTSEFFLEIDGIDIQSMETVDMEKDFRIIYKKKPRTVNLCPYCRAIVGAVIMFPFIVLWRLFPHKKTKQTHAEIMRKSQRNTKIVRIVVAGVMGGMGIWKILDNDYFTAIFYFGLVFFNLFSVQILKWVAQRLPKIKHKERQIKKQKPTPRIIKTISEKHDIICPPLWFIDKEDLGKLT